MVRDDVVQDPIAFPGFQPPTENWSKLPHEFIDVLAMVETVGELKTILYILRHTWGFQEQQKKITMDEFEHGRKRRDGTRMDTGTGLTNPTIRDGLKRAEAHGFIEVEVDDRDLGRVKRFYSLRMNVPQEPVKKSQPPEKESIEGGKKVCPRTEKDTLEKDTTRKSDIIPQATLAVVDPPTQSIKSQSRVSAGSCKKSSVPPAVTVFRSETQRYPAKSWYADLEKIQDLDRWRSVVHAYIGLGWNPTNVKGMLEWYDRNEIPQVKGAQYESSSGVKPQAATPEVVAAFRAHQAAKRRAAGVEEVRAGTGPPG